MNVYYTAAATDSRAFLKKILEREGIGNPVLACSPHGKPYLAEGGPHFNLTHTNGFMAVAVGAQEVGIDAERRTRPVPPAVARRRTPVEREEDFAALWTAKEAYIKLCGGSIADMLPSLCFERGVLYFAGRPVEASFLHLELCGCTVCVCTRRAEGLRLIPLDGA